MQKTSKKVAPASPTKSPTKDTDVGLVGDLFSKQSIPMKQVAVGADEEKNDFRASDSLVNPSSLLQSGRDMLNSAVEAVTHGVEGVREKAKELIQGAEKSVDEARHSMEDGANKAKEATTKLKSHAKENVQEAVSRARDAMSSAGHKVKDTAKEGVNKGKEGMNKAKEGIKQGVNDTKEKAHDIKDDIKDKVSNVKEDIKDKVNHAKDNVRNAKDDIKDNVNHAKDDIKGKMNDAKDNFNNAKNKVKDNVNQAKNMLDENASDSRHNSAKKIGDSLYAIDDEQMNAENDQRDDAENDQQDDQQDRAVDAVNDVDAENDQQDSAVDAEQDNAENDEHAENDEVRDRAHDFKQQEEEVLERAREKGKEFKEQAASSSAAPASAAPASAAPASAAPAASAKGNIKPTNTKKPTAPLNAPKDRVDRMDTKEEEVESQPNAKSNIPSSTRSVPGPTRSNKPSTTTTAAAPSTKNANPIADSTAGKFAPPDTKFDTTGIPCDKNKLWAHQNYLWDTYGQNEGDEHMWPENNLAIVGNLNETEFLHNDNPRASTYGHRENVATPYVMHPERSNYTNWRSQRDVNREFHASQRRNTVSADHFHAGLDADGCVVDKAVLRTDPNRVVHIQNYAYNDQTYSPIERVRFQEFPQEHVHTHFTPITHNNGFFDVPQPPHTTQRTTFAERVRSPTIVRTHLFNEPSLVMTKDGWREDKY